MLNLIKNNWSLFMTLISLLFFGIIKFLVRTKNIDKKYIEIQEKQMVLKHENKKIKESIEVNKILKQKIENDSDGKIKRAKELLEQGQIDVETYKIAMERTDLKKKLKENKINVVNIETTPHHMKNVLGSEIEDTI